MASRPARTAVGRWPLGAASTTLLLTTSLAVGTGVALLVRVLGGSAHDVAPAHVQPVRPALAGDATWTAGRRMAPAFTLRDQNGQLVSLAGERGHVVLLAFMDSHCKLLCTLEGPTLHKIQSRLGPASRSVRLLVVSVNPWGDTAASSIRAGNHWGFTGPWRWLRGPPSQLERVWRGYGIEVRQAFGDVNHSSAIYIIDRRGYERAGFNYPFPARAVLRDLRKLAGQPAPS